MPLGKYTPIIEQLSRQPILRGLDVAEGAVVIVITKLEHGNLTFDFIFGDQTEYGLKMVRVVGMLIATLLKQQAPLIILCPMDAEGNKAPSGETWDDPVKHLQFTEHMCLAMMIQLCRNRDTKEIIISQPERAIFIGTIGDGAVTELQGALDRIRAKISESMVS